MYPTKHRCSREVPEKQTIVWTTYHPQRAYLAQYIQKDVIRGHHRNGDCVQMNAAATAIVHQGIGVSAVLRIKPASKTPWATTERGAHIHAYQPTSPCRIPRPDNQNTVIIADASGTTGLTPAAGGADPALRPDESGQLRQHHLTGTSIFGASSHGELKTLAIIVDVVTAISKLPQTQPHPVWLVIDAAMDIQIVRRLAKQPLHKGTDSSLGTQALHLWVAFRNLPGDFVLHLIKQESHRYNLGDGHMSLHAQNQLAEHVPTPDEPPLHDHMHTHLQHLPPILHPGEPPRGMVYRVYSGTMIVTVYRYTGIQVQIVFRGLQDGIQVYRSTGSLQKAYKGTFGLGIVQCSIFLRMYQLASIVRHAQYSTTLLGSPDSSCIDVLVRGEEKKTRPLSQLCTCGPKFLLKLWHHKTS